NVGTIDLTTFQTTRYVSNIEATGIAYDAFSDSILVAAFGKSHQIDPANPGVVISSRDDSLVGESYIDLKPDGLGHLLTTRWARRPGRSYCPTIPRLDSSAIPARDTLLR